MSPRLAVAMSGGVDSSVAARLLRDAGNEVIGVTLHFGSRAIVDGAEPAATRCCGLDGVAAAEAAAAAIGIPLHVIDASDAFAERVLRPAWDDYSHGRTPNPCVLCNESLKLGLLADEAARLGAERIATGHYVRLSTDPDTGEPSLQRGRDAAKDQSYFLFRLSTPQLRRALFPLGGMYKSEIRDLARRFGLPSATLAESQDVCFRLPGEGGFAEALRLRFRGESRQGPFLDPAGRVIGQHAGIHRFTVGQRRGLGLALGQPAYVLRIDDESGAVVVSRDPRCLLARGLIASDVRWLAGVPFDRALRGEVQIRYRHTAAPASIEVREEGHARVLFDQPQRAVTPGQAAVFYRGEQLLGGGWIARALVHDTADHDTADHDIADHDIAGPDTADHDTAGT